MKRTRKATAAAKAAGSTKPTSATRAKIAGDPVRIGQAWIEPVAEDVEAMSALAVAHGRLPAGRMLQGLRRMRIFELRGSLPDRAELADLLHRSTQFYNPAKERCSVRLEAHDASPVATGEVGLLVLERGGDRRPAAERWWRHETGRRVEIHEGVAWLLRFRGGRKEEAARELAVLRDREHGLLVNPHWQDAQVAAGEAPIPWIMADAPTGRAASKPAVLRKTAGARRLKR